MLNTDYKILARAISNRMKSIFDELISPCQTGFMKGRQISNTIRITMDLTRYNSKISGYILSLDFEKCFDCIEYNAILGSLKYLGFGENFLSWCKLLFEDFTSTTTNNSYFSTYFPVTRSCHQGCPQPHFFIMLAERY